MHIWSLRDIYILITPLLLTLDDRNFGFWPTIFRHWASTWNRHHTRTINLYTVRLQVMPCTGDILQITVRIPTTPITIRSLYSLLPKRHVNCGVANANSRRADQRTDTELKIHPGIIHATTAWTITHVSHLTNDIDSTVKYWVCGMHNGITVIT